jgi:integrase
MEPRRTTAGESEPWSVAGLRQFLHHVRDHHMYAAWLLFATTGMGRGEVARLAREDLDLDKGHVRVSWTLDFVDNKPTWKPAAKSRAGERVIALDPATLDALRQRLADQAGERLALGSKWPSR